MTAAELRSLLETVPNEALVMWKNLEGNFIGVATVEYKPNEFLLKDAQPINVPVVVFGVEKGD